MMTNNSTFTTMSGTTFTTNESGTYFYAIWTEEGKKIKKRIKKSEYEQARKEHELEVATKMHESLERLIDEANERAETAEIEEVQKEMSPEPKPKKKKTKKNAFYTSTAVPGLTLTEKQVSFILHLSDTCFWENGLDSIIWVDVLCDDIGGEFTDKPMTVGAMISTLCEKGLGIRTKEHRNKKKYTSFKLTDIGKLVAADLGLE